MVWAMIRRSFFVTVLSKLFHWSSMMLFWARKNFFKSSIVISSLRLNIFSFSLNHSFSSLLNSSTSFIPLFFNKLDRRRCILDISNKERAGIYGGIAYIGTPYVYCPVISCVYLRPRNYRDKS